MIVCAKHIQNRYTTFQNKFQKLIEKHLTFSVLIGNENGILPLCQSSNKCIEFVKWHKRSLNESIELLIHYIYDDDVGNKSYLFGTLVPKHVLVLRLDTESDRLQLSISIKIEIQVK